MKIIYFYSMWDSNSLKQREKFIETMKTLDGIDYELCAIDENKEKWLKYGLKTVPGIVVLKDDAVVCFFAGSIDWEAVKNYIIRNINCDLKEFTYQVERYNVVWSSSCHRYDRWNEQLLNVDGYNTGWSSVSNKENGNAVLVIDLYRLHRLNAIGLVPRKWEFNKDLKDSFPDIVCVKVSEDGVNWIDKGCVLIKEKSEANEKRIEIEPVDCRYVRLEFMVNNLRLEKKFFVQLTNLIFYAQYKEENDRKMDEPSFGKINVAEDYLDGIVNKRGVSYGERTTTSVWFMNEHQKMSERCFYDAQIVLIPLGGKMTIQWGEEKKRDVSNGEWVKVPIGCVCGISNETNEKCCFLEVVENVPSYCAWSLRK